jgi:hypothetical protein
MVDVTDASQLGEANGRGEGQCVEDYKELDYHDYYGCNKDLIFKTDVIATKFSAQIPWRTLNRPGKFDCGGKRKNGIVRGQSVDNKPDILGQSVRFSRNCFMQQILNFLN